MPKVAKVLRFVYKRVGNSEMSFEMIIFSITLKFHGLVMVVVEYLMLSPMTIRDMKTCRKSHDHPYDSYDSTWN